MDKLYEILGKFVKLPVIQRVGILATIWNMFRHQPLWVTGYTCTME